jgi:hypothetical protein
MAETAPGDHEFSMHPELARMTAEGVDVAEVIALAGYVGASGKQELVRLHPELDDMSVSIDIAKSDILAIRDAPAPTMPLGGVIVWLARTADVTFRRTRTVSSTAQQVRRFFDAGSVLEPNNPERAVDRLNIQMGPTFRAKVPPVYIPPDQCAVCTSKNCSSHCLPPCQSQ